MNIVKTITTFFEGGLRKIKYLRLGKSDVQTSFEAMPYGFDSVPIKDIRAIYSKTGEDGKTVIIGYINTGQLESLKPGESRIFSTDSEGVLSFDIVLKDDGTAEIGGNSDNMVRFSEMETAYNELNNKFNNHITNWNAFATAYVPGSPTTIGLPPTASTSSSSSGDISGAKISEIKTLA